MRVYLDSRYVGVHYGSLPARGDPGCGSRSSSLQYRSGPVEARRRGGRVGVVSALDPGGEAHVPCGRGQFAGAADEVGEEGDAHFVVGGFVKSGLRGVERAWPAWVRHIIDHVPGLGRLPADLAGEQERGWERTCHGESQGI